MNFSTDLFYRLGCGNGQKNRKDRRAVEQFGRRSGKAVRCQVRRDQRRGHTESLQMGDGPRGTCPYTRQQRRAY